MLKNEVAIIGAGLGGTTVAYGFQQRNYNAALINGSTQDNETLPDAKNVMVLEYNYLVFIYQIKTKQIFEK